MPNRHLPQSVRDKKKRQQLIFSGENKLTRKGSLKSPYNVWHRRVNIYLQDAHGESSVPHPVRMELVSQEHAEQLRERTKQKILAGIKKQVA